MSTSEKSPNESMSTMDRPSPSVPSVDRPWDDPVDRAHRRSVIKGDRSSHRVYHGLYEDLLN